MYIFVYPSYYVYALYSYIMKSLLLSGQRMDYSYQNKQSNMLVNQSKSTLSSHNYLKWWRQVRNVWSVLKMQLISSES